MKISTLLGERVKETPNSAMVKSHAYLLRAGYIKQVGAGIFTLLPPAQRVSQKIQNIIREEMNKIGGQEVLFPVVMPREIWDASGRYTSIGDEMVRFKDRNGHDMLLGMTHEEAAVHACINTVKSYTQLPFMIYQIQTKFRDEARPRAGLIRVREFTMKDAYSFHENQTDLELYYNEVYKAYERIYRRMGMENFIAVAGDSGMMGGKVSHEFMLLTDIGEDSLVICPTCGYKANQEVAICKNTENKTIETPKAEECYTGSDKSIEDVCKSLNISASQTCKAVCYAVKGDENRIVVAFIRGDKEINESKLSRVVKGEVVIKDLTNTGLVAGNIGPIGLNIKNAEIVFDKSLENLHGCIVGANKSEYHIKNVVFGRDVMPSEYFDIAVVQNGDKCVSCGAPLRINRGIEIGNIFQLGTKYTKSMDFKVHMRDGSQGYPIMGCYGIGVGRSLASVAEEQSDEKGLVWPMTIAPWQVYVCPIKYDQPEVKTETDKLVKALESNGAEVLLDDRNVSPGIKFADSELMGIPLRLVISPKSLQAGAVELTSRKSGDTKMVGIQSATETIIGAINQQLKKLNNV